MEVGNITKFFDQDVLTISDLCEMLKISKRYAYQFIRQNNIKSLRIGRKIYISKKSLEKYLNMEE